MSILVKKYNIFFIHVKELKIMPLSMPIENSLWHSRIGIFNLNRAYKVSRLPPANCHFNVLFFQFLFFIIKLFFRSKLPKLLLLIHYIVAMYSFICIICYYWNQVTLKSIQVLWIFKTELLPLEPQWYCRSWFC